MTRRTRLWNKYSETEQSWSTMPTVVTRIQTAMRRHVRWKLKLPRQLSRTTTTITTKHRRTRRDQLDWDPEKIMMTFIPWWTKTGPLWYPYQGKDLWTRMKRVRWRLGRKDTGKFEKTCEIQSQYVVIIIPSQAVSRKSCVRPCSRRNHRDETETSAHHSETKRDHSTERVTGAELRKRTRCYRCRQLGHRRESVRIQHRRTSHNLQPRISFCQEMPLQSCIICSVTCCLMVVLRLWWSATLIRSILSSLVWSWDQLVAWRILEHSNLWWDHQLLCDGVIDFSSGTV